MRMVRFRPDDDDLALMRELRRPGESTTHLLRRALRLARTLEDREALRRSATHLGADPADLAEIRAVRLDLDGRPLTPP